MNEQISNTVQIEKLGFAGLLALCFLCFKSLVGRNLGILTIQAHLLGLIHFFDSITPSVSGCTFVFLAK